MTSTTTPTTSTLSADWQKAVAIFQDGEQAFTIFLSKAASGAEIFIEDIEEIGQWTEAHLGVITTTISALSAAAAVVAPGNATVTKVIADLQISANDVAQLSSSLASGSTAGDAPAVTTAVTTIGAVQTLAQLAAQAGASLATLTNAAPTATTTVSPPTSAEG